MIPAKWGVDDENRAAVERILDAVSDVDRGLLIAACGTIAANHIADVAFERSGELEDARTGAEAFFQAMAHTIQRRWAQ